MSVCKLEHATTGVLGSRQRSRVVSLILNNYCCSRMNLSFDRTSPKFVSDSNVGAEAGAETIDPHKLAFYSRDSVLGEILNVCGCLA